MLDRIAETVLSNGLKLICLKKTEAPIISLQIWYKTGSANERDGIRGISHFLEHMMFRGSKNIGSEEHARRINDIGGHCNAFTAEDVTAYLDNVPRQYLDMVLQMETDRMQGLLFDPELLETERKVITEEYHTYMNNPVTKAFLEFRKDFFAGNPYELSPLGELKDIQTLSAADCRSYFEQWYTPGNAVAVIVGDFDKEEDVFRRAEDTIGKVRPDARNAVESSDRFRRTRAEPGLHRMKRRVEFDVPLLVMGFAAPPSSDKDALPLEIMQLVVSQGETSRLYREIVRNRSLAVMTGGMNHYLKYSGMSLFFAVFTPDVSVKRVEKSLAGEIDRIRREGITQTEMEKVKNATLTHRVFELYSAEHLCHRIGYSETVEGDYKLWVHRLKILESLSLDDLIEVARRYWSEDNRHVLYLQPKKVPLMLYFAGLARRIFRGRAS
jgi:zinc protease